MTELLTEKEKNDLRILLERMYQLNGDDTFSGLVSEIWEFLGIKEECSVTAFENALIDTISDYTAVKDSDTRNTKRSKAKKRDSLLLMFGLLAGEGYYHTELNENDRRVSVTADERIFRYVKQSDYKKLRSKKEKSDDKLCRKAVYRAQRREVTDENRFFDFLINRIDGKTDARTNDKTFQKYVQEYIDSPPETIELPDGRKRIVLPQSRYTEENFLSNSKTINNKIAESSPERSNEVPDTLDANAIIVDTSQNGSEESHKHESDLSSIQDNFPSATEQQSPCPALVEDASSKDDILTGETLELENELGEDITEPAREQKSESNNTHNNPSLATRQGQEMDGRHEDDPIEPDPPEPPVPKPDSPPDIQLKLSKTTGLLKTATVAFVISILVLVIIVFGHIINKRWAILQTLEDYGMNQESNSIEFTNTEE